MRDLRRARADLRTFSLAVEQPLDSGGGPLAQRIEPVNAGRLGRDEVRPLPLV